MKGLLKLLPLILQLAVPLLERKTKPKTEAVGKLDVIVKNAPEIAKIIRKL